MNELQQLLISGMPLYISIDGFRQAMLTAFPLSGKVGEFSQAENKFALTTEDISYLTKHSWYQYKTHLALEELLKGIAQIESLTTISLTDEFDNEELPENSIAYHRVWGTILSDSEYWFSSKQLAADLIAAESNPKISCHFLHMNSPGGEAWYLDRLSEILRNCEKPIVTLYEQMCCSAGYYIGCHGNKVYSLTANDYVGCIGTMVSFYDFEPYFAKLGIKKVEAKATNSDLKNKTFDDLRTGKDEKFVNDILNPLNEQFLSEVRSQREKLAQLDDTAPVLRGETFYTSDAVEIGLADGRKTFTEVVTEAVMMGREYAKTKNLKNAIYDFV